MWGQAVENLTRDCILKAVANGALDPSEPHLENTMYKHGLSSLVDTLKPCIDDSLYDSIKSFSKDRNELAHRAADRYMTTIIVAALEPIDQEEIDIEIWKCQETKKTAGDIYGRLLDIHGEYSS